MPAQPSNDEHISVADYGTTDGKNVVEYTLKNDHGYVLKVITYGAIVTELHVPDRDGKLANVVSGLDDLAAYQTPSPYFGATIGRVANRIMNARFELEGKPYSVAANDAPHHLHGGNKGWDKVVWTATPKETPGGPSLVLTYDSPDGEEGYPGAVRATTTYTLTNAGEFVVEMTATTTRTTLLNMAHHSYWNLAGHDSGSILDHELTLFADRYTPGNLVPDGKVVDVEGTPWDFRTPKPIGRDLKRAGGDPVGFDHNFIVNGDPHAMRPVAKLKDPKSGRVMTLEANQPGVQFYSGNFLDGSLSGKGATYPQYSALCLESQKFPNSINVPAWRDEVVFEPGEEYRHRMVHRFSVE